MAINWDEVQKVLIPIKDYEDICHRLLVSFGYSYITDAYNFTLPKLGDYTQRLLGEDSRGRYTEYASRLIEVIAKLHRVGVQNVLSLKDKTASREHLELFTEKSGVAAVDVVILLKYLIYWVIPNEKYLSGLVRGDPHILQAIKILGGLGVRTSLQLLQAGITSEKRTSLAETSGIPTTIISELVNRADFSRLPWASKATISNIIGAGYASLAQLAHANPDQLYADFFRYGKSIGKNLKLGNEIENSYRIAKIVPVVLQEE